MTTYLELLADAAALDGIDLSPPYEGRVGADGLALRYVDWGGDGPDVLLLHGGCMTCHVWDTVCLQLRDWGARCVALDQRGHGLSDWSPGGDYLVDDHALDVAAVIDGLGLDRPMLVGHSMGGLNALCAVARAGVEAAGVVLVDIAPGHSLGAADRLVDALRDAEHPSEDLVRRLARGSDPRLGEFLVDHNLRRVDDRWAWRHDPQLLNADIMRETRESAARLAAELDAVPCPLLLIRGSRSSVLTAADAAAFSEARLVTVDGAGHSVHGDQPVEVARIIRHFMDAGR